MTSFGVDTGVVSGQRSGWSLIRKLGEGDAGEVYLVESLVDNRTAILKRPVRTVFTGEVRRQADQIRTEGRILKALEDILGKLPDARISTPPLLDQSKPGSEFGDRFFIVLGRAAGFDLSTLARIARMGINGDQLPECSPVEQAFLEELARQARMPERVLLACLSAVLTVLEAAHATPVDTGTGEAAGIIWNDVKADHLFWDPTQSGVTVIDWGNGRFLQEGGVSRDMRHTAAGDRRQFLDEMGRLLAQAAPELRERLEWPEQGHIYEDVTPTVMALRERIDAALAQANHALQEARTREEELLQPALESGLDLAGLEAVHRTIVSMGEIPDYAGALRMISRSASNLAAAGDMGGVRELSSWAAGLPGAQVESLALLARLSSVAAREQGEAYTALVAAVQAAATAHWDETLWQMVSALGAGVEPEWWDDLLPRIREQAGGAIGGAAVAALRPLLTLRRLYLSIQSSSYQLEDRLARNADSEQQDRLDQWMNLGEKMRAVIYNWVQVDPLPPHSMLAYSDLEPLINEIEDFFPHSGDDLLRAIELPRRQVQDILEAWGRKEFIDAAGMLRHLLVLDPDRRRLLRAAEVLKAAPTWLQRVNTGPQPGENLLEFVTNLEYEGRELRNQLGPAGWLDGNLEGLKSMRRGTWPGDLMLEQPVLVNEMPWLQRFERVERVQKLFYPNQPVLAPLPCIHGMRETRYGPETELAFMEALDAWIPEARGSSARAYLATFRAGSGEQREAALKIMRNDKADYALPLFKEEINVLTAMQDVPGVARMIECGFLWMGDPVSLPSDHNLGAIQALRGEALRIGPDAAAQFLDLADARVREGWTPYLLIERRRREDNLLLLCDASLNRGRFLPVTDLLLMAIQIVDLLAEAHARNVVYRDHKILHYYWQPELNGISLIDWNVARYHPEGLTDMDIHMDLVQLGARGLHHVLTGRTAPGALPLGPTRPDEIEQAAETYGAQWTFDDKRLSVQIRMILEQLLAGSYTNAADLRDDLKRAYMELE